MRLSYPVVLVSLISILVVLSGCSSSSQKENVLTKNSWLKTKQQQAWLQEILSKKDAYAQAAAVKKLYTREGLRSVPVLIEAVRITGDASNIRYKSQNKLSSKEWELLGNAEELHSTVYKLLQEAGVEGDKIVDAKDVIPFLFCGWRIQELAFVALDAADKDSMASIKDQLDMVWRWGLKMQGDTLEGLAVSDSQRAIAITQVIFSGQPDSSLQAAALKTLLYADKNLAMKKTREVLGKEWKWYRSWELRCTAASVLARAGDEATGIGTLIEFLDGYGSQPASFKLRWLTGQSFQTIGAVEDKAKWKEWYEKSLKENKKMVKESLRK